MYRIMIIPDLAIWDLPQNFGSVGKYMHYLLADYGPSMKLHIACIIQVCINITAQGSLPGFTVLYIYTQFRDFSRVIFTIHDFQLILELKSVLKCYFSVFLEREVFPGQFLRLKFLRIQFTPFSGQCWFFFLVIVCWAVSFFFPDLCLNFCYPALNIGAASKASLPSGFHLDMTKGKYQQETRGREPVTLGIYSWAFPWPS